mmetsp:Transcript_76060/g.114523  ORF Transcript_76060/g.114523 Transcript_76060/m.114523 type:complete len:272 (+) Transcript_76060:252-1067(+)
MSRHIGGGQTDWSVIISSLLQESCSELLGDDIALFAERLKSIMVSWFDPSWESCVSNYGEKIPTHLKEEVHAHYLKLVETWCIKMRTRMADLVEYSIRDYNASSFKQRLISRPMSSSAFSPAASSLFTSIMEEIAPHTIKNFSASSMLESNLCSQTREGNPSVFEDEAFDLELRMEDRPEDPVVLEKLRKICSCQVQFGNERIRETFQFVFETMFKRPLCTKLPAKLIDWSTKLPDILKERLREDNIMLQDIEQHISLIARVISTPVHFVE